MSLLERIRAALRASLFGWIAGLAASSPFQIVEAVRNAGAGTRLLAYELAIVLGLWTVLTFAMALYWCGFFLLPVVWLTSAGWVARRRWPWIAASTIFGLVLMALRLHVWTALDHDGIGLFNFFMWCVFAGTFFATAATWFAKFLRAAAETPA